MSDRDFALDYLAAAAQCSLHLSRLAEELINWASPPFGFVQLSDQWSTGSSIMPQKRNPDAAELVRGHSGRIVGLFTGLMITMKGLPLAYSKDMQDDKAPTFEAHDLLALSLAALAGSVESATFKPERMREVAAQGFATATDLADWLVREAGVPFREAHHITGRAVKAAEDAGCDLADLPLDTLQAIDARIDAACLRRAQRRSLGQQSDQLRRHCAGPRSRAGGAVEGAARLDLRATFFARCAAIRRRRALSLMKPAASRWS